jgi:hypothetical protein
MNAVMEREDVERADRPLSEMGAVPVVRTDTVYVVFTGPEETIAAARVAQRMAQAMKAGVTLVQLRIRPVRLPGHEPDGLAQADFEAAANRVRSEVGPADTRIYVGSSERRVAVFAFRPHSLVVLAGRHHWWGSPAERWRRLLETAGHRVVFVDTQEQADA